MLSLVVVTVFSVILVKIVICSAVLSPFATAITVWLSYTQRRNIYYYGFVGALCSLFLLLPWFYVTFWMFGKRLPNGLVVGVYCIVYAIWTLCLIFTYVIEPNLHALAIVSITIGCVAAVSSGSVLMWRYNRGYKVGRSRYFEGKRVSDLGLSDIVYGLPFALLTAQIVLLRWYIRYSIYS